MNLYFISLLIYCSLQLRQNNYRHNAIGYNHLVNIGQQNQKYITTFIITFQQKMNIRV